MLRQEVVDYYRNFRVTPDLIERPQPARGRGPDRAIGPFSARRRGLHYTPDFFGYASWRRAIPSSFRDLVENGRLSPADSSRGPVCG